MKTRPIVIDVTSPKGGIGKTLSPDRAKDHFLSSGRQVTMIRIESQCAFLLPQPNEIRIKTEDLAVSNDVVGGAAAMLEPVWDAISVAVETNGVVIMDWGAGQSEYRLELLASTSFGQRLNEVGVSAYSFVVTDRSIQAMRPAIDTLKSTREFSPELQCVVVTNELRGDFAFPMPMGQLDGDF